MQEIAMLEKLDEISRMAAVKASAALSKTIQYPVGVDVSPAVELEKNELPKWMAGDDSLVAMTVPITGDLNGVAVMTFAPDVAMALCDLIYQKKIGDTKTFSEMEQSALTELANIVIGNFLELFAYPLQLDSVMHRAPSFKCDKYVNIKEHIELAMKNNINQGAMIELVINLNHTKIKGFFIIVLGTSEVNQAISQMSRMRNE